MTNPLPQPSRRNQLQAHRRLCHFACGGLFVGACSTTAIDPEGEQSDSDDSTLATMTSDTGDTDQQSDDSLTQSISTHFDETTIPDESDDDETNGSSTDVPSTDDGGDKPDDLPPVTGTCPTFANGDLTFTPSGLNKARKARIWRSDAADERDGPLVFYWHGTGSSPAEAIFGLSQTTIDAIVEQGGIVVAPYHDPDAGAFPWFLVTGSREDDLILADEVVACAQQELGIDSARIHTLGMSAGGLHASQMSWRRSSYVASAVIYSGGLSSAPPPDQDPANPFSAMLFHGGKDDVVVISFEEASIRYLDALQAAGHFGFICDHGQGHSIPTDASASVWRFLQDHPFHTIPEPYENGLPSSFPGYCTL